MSLQGKVALVTGASRGIGQAIALELGRQGAGVIGTATSASGAERIAATLKENGVQGTGLELNVTNDESVAAVLAQITAQFGAPAILVNNAGILRDGLLIKVKDGVMTKMSLAQWQAVIDVNLTGVFLCTREVAAKMIELNSQGAIINISSISRAGNVGQTNYSAAKAGVAAATVTWAKELSRYGIRVAGIAPGFIETEMTLGMKPEALEKMTSGIPLKRMGKVEEIAHSAAYIFENDYYTGRILEMDGGLRI